MNTSSHNAFCKKGVPEKSIRNVPQNALLPGDSTKEWDDFSKERPPIHLSYPPASPTPVFRCEIVAKYPLTNQNSRPYTSNHRKQYLIKTIESNTLSNLSNKMI
jgi:hypothetical protein